MPQSSGEKTEKASAKKKRDARERGQVFKSTELVTAFSMMVVFGALSLFGGSIVRGIEQMMTDIFSSAGSESAGLGEASAAALFYSVILQAAKLILPILGAALLAGLLFNYLQVGFIFSFKAAAPSLAKISMIQGFKRIFSKRTLVDLFKSFLIISLLGLVSYNEFRAGMQTMPMMMAGDITQSVRAMASILLSVAFKLAIALAVLAPFDYLYQWWKYQKDLMMTKQEVREEYKLLEGDPQVKGRIREKQRRISAMRMMQAITQADVVITNPTHYAIAIVYQEGKNKAPVVVAKGKDLLAKRIREKARELHIEIVENRAVAQYLYFFCDIGDEVPEEMYQAVAEILAYVYRLKQKTGGIR